MGFSKYSWAALSALLTVTACSEAAWNAEQYGPVSQGLVGGAFGYQDTPLGANAYRIKYTDTGHDRALSRAYRRAAELCAGNGARRFAAGNVSVDTTFALAGSLTVANVDARCGTGRASVAAQLSAPLASRNREASMVTGASVASQTGYNATSVSAASAAPERTVEDLATSEISFDDFASQAGPVSGGGGGDCSAGDVRREEDRIASLGMRKSNEGGLGNQVLAVDMMADLLIPLYRRCGTQAKLNDALAKKQWAVEQRANLGLN